MAPKPTQYTLVGFSTDLDWRPLCFMKPIPPYGVCGACGLVRKRTALLPCSHTLCESCYEQSAKDGVRVCPLDGQRCKATDVDLKEFRVADLLRRKVKCWNEASGCSAVLPASVIAQHFQRECRHHCIRCPTCSATVLCTEVCAHLESECCSAAKTAARGCQGDSGSKEEAPPVETFKANLEQQAGEIKAPLGQLLTASGANSDRPNEIGHGVNNCLESMEVLKQAISGVTDTVQHVAVKKRTENIDYARKRSDETAAFREVDKERFIAGSDTTNLIREDEKQLGEEFPKAASKKRDNNSQAAGGSEGAAAQPEDSNNAMGGVDAVVPKPPDLFTSVCEFDVDVKLLQEAYRLGQCISVSDRVYLRGYYITPGVLLDQDLIRGVIFVNKGDMDDVVQWPFIPKVIFRFPHPSGEERRQIEVFGSFFLPRKRPLEGSEAYIYKGFTPVLTSLSGLISGGFVEDDQFRVIYELLP